MDGFEPDTRRRTWVHIIDLDCDEQIDDSCELRQPSELTGIWFAVPNEAAPPARIVVVLEDTFTGRAVESNILSLAC